MSLRRRILVLFLVFAILPVAVLGAGDYLQSMQALRVAVDARGTALAGQAAREMERGYDAARAELSRIGERLTRDGAFSSAAAARSVIPEEPGLFEELRLLQGGALSWALPLPSTADSSCSSGAGLTPVRVSIPGPGALELEGRIAAHRLLAAAGGPKPAIESHTQLVSPSSGSVVYDSRCDRLSEQPSAAIAKAVRRIGESSQSVTRSLSQAVDGHTWNAAVAFASGPEVGVVVYTSEDEFLAPFRATRLRYLMATIALLFLTGLGFLLFAGREFRSLGALTEAADEIRVGNLAPWLPPPGDDEVGHLTLAFRNMIDRLSESLRQVELSQKLAAVGELAAYLSHEIRNPLSSIRLSLQSLHRDLRSGFIPDDADRVIEIALNEVNRLDGVMRTVLEMGRQQGQGGERICAVHEGLADTLEVLQPKIRAQGVELEYVPRADDDQVRGEAEGLRGVWVNLLVNALDALKDVPDARIRVSTWTAPSARGELHVRIADNGPGVPPDILDSIFEPFFTTKVRGNGIGLPTALRTVQPWGGTITYEPVAAGSGAVFVVRLKLAGSDPAETTTPEEAALEPALPN